jgi:iron(III) transport system permease protein
MTRRRVDVWTFAQVAIWMVVLTLLVWPLSSAVRACLAGTDGTGLTLANYIEVLSRPRHLAAIRNTLIAGFGGMTGAVLLGGAVAWLTTHYRLRGETLLRTLAVLALVSPPFIGAYAWIVLFGANGVVRHVLADIGIGLPSLYGAGGVILVFSFKFFPNVFLFVATALAQVNRSLEEAAEGLGLSPGRRFLKITVPMVLPALSAGAALAFVLSIADFGTPRLIGRNFDVLATQAYNLYTAELGDNPGIASALSMVLVGISVLLVAIQRRLLRGDVYHGSALRRPYRVRPRGWRSALAHVVAYGIVFVGVLPAIVVGIFSFRRTSGPVFQTGFDTQSYQRVFHNVMEPVWNTLIFSTSSVAAIVVVGTMLGYILVRRPSRFTTLLDGLLMVPYVVPGVVMGIAFVTCFNAPPLAITGTGLVIILAVFIRRLPYAARSATAAMQQLAPNLEDAAVSLGYSRGRAFLRITAPLILPSIVAGGIMSFVTAINELSSSLVLYVGSTITMPVRTYVAVINGDYGVAAALSSLLLAMTGICVVLAFQLTGGKQELR